ncbi:MAG: hypothetical protein KGL93_04825 [Gemmatimonadota bacterium]|nr:hypothetical protein [Gemmatimonadota bacterium]HEU4988757.1 hypothetical protein [Gemmatimonadaceae bacterium]
MSDTSTSRKWAGRGIQLLLVVVALAYVGNWVRGRFSRGVREMHVSSVAMPPDSLGPGDIRIYNADSTVDLLLVGDRIYAGLSPQMVAKVRRDMDTSAHADTGLGGSIAHLVKSKVAGAIGTHVVYKVADIRDVRLDNGTIVLDWKKGGHQTMFETTNVNGRRADNTFRPEDAQRFIDAVRARQQQLGNP